MACGRYGMACGQYGMWHVADIVWDVLVTQVSPAVHYLSVGVVHDPNAKATGPKHGILGRARSGTIDEEPTTKRNQLQSLIEQQRTSPPLVVAPLPRHLNSTNTTCSAWPCTPQTRWGAIMTIS